MNPVVTKFTKNLGLITIGSFATKIVAYLLIPLYTSILTTEEYGTCDIIFTTSSLLMPVFSLVIFEAVMRFCLDRKLNQQEIISSGLVVLVTGTLAFLLLSPLMLLLESIRSYYFLFVLYFVSLMFSNFFSYAARGLNKIKEYTLAGVISTCVLIGLNILLLVYFKLGIIGYILSYIVSRAITVLYLAIRLRNSIRLFNYNRINFGIIKELLKYSIPMIPNTISWWVSSSSDKYIILAYHGVSLNGLYSVASKIPSLLTAIQSIFNTAWQISACDDLDDPQYSKAFTTVYYTYYSFIFITSGILILTTRILATLLFKADFFTAWIFSPILVYASAVHALSTFYGSIFMAAKKTGFMMKSTIAGAAANIVLNFLLVPRFGGIGAASATAISYLIVYVLRIRYAKSLASFKATYMNNMICNILLIISVVLTCQGKMIFDVLSAVSVFIIIIMRRDAVISILKTIKKCEKKS